MPRGVMMQDVLRTNQVFRQPERSHNDLPDEVLQALWSVKPQYLQAAWQVINDEHGGMAAYLRGALALNQPALNTLAQR